MPDFTGSAKGAKGAWRDVKRRRRLGLGEHVRKSLRSHPAPLRRIMRGLVMAGAITSSLRIAISSEVLADGEAERCEAPPPRVGCFMLDKPKRLAQPMHPNLMRQLRVTPYGHPLLRAL